MNCPKYRFWSDIFEYGKENEEYFLERQTFVELFAERNQKFIQIKNVCEVKRNNQVMIQFMFSDCTPLTRSTKAENLLVRCDL